MSDFPDWEFRPPIRSDQGIPSRARRGVIGRRWWSARWIQTLEALSLDGGARLARGRAYARQGQVLQLQEEPGGIRALVQGSRPRPYTVRVRVASYPERRREALLQALAQEAGHLAALLSGDVTEGLAEAFAAAGAPLFPVAEDDLALECDCPDAVSPCKHAAAVQYLLAERLDDDPLLLLRLRGWDLADLLADLERRLPVGDENPAVDDAPMATVAPAALPEASLAEDLARFWRAGRGLERLSAGPQAPAVPLPILRRLGQPEFMEADLARLLGPAIVRAAEAARRLAEGGAAANGDGGAG